MERVFLILAQAFADKGYSVDLVLTSTQGDYADKISGSINVVELAAAGIWRSRLKVLMASGKCWPSLLRAILFPIKSSRILRHLSALENYLKHTQPTVLISGMSYPNLVAALAGRAIQHAPRLILTEHNTLSQTIHYRRRMWRWRYLPKVIKHIYSMADRIVAVSSGVADDLARTTGLPRDSITTVYNPVVTPGLMQQAQEPADHPWFASGEMPVILAVGRLERVKAFDVLIEAFARLRAHRKARLVILGEGRERNALQGLVAKLGVEQDVNLPGFVANPYRYMARANLFVLSSRHEGLPTVLIEALACGCPVVSTDCPSGPREILDGGQYGSLVQVGDVAALTDAMLKVLDQSPSPERQRLRAQDFSLEKSVCRYWELCFNRESAA